jgi:hypothetical protein
LLFLIFRKLQSGNISWAIAYPTMLLVMPWVKKLVAALVASA